MRRLTIKIQLINRWILTKILLCLFCWRQDHGEIFVASKTCRANAAVLINALTSMISHSESVTAGALPWQVLFDYALPLQFNYMLCCHISRISLETSGPGTSLNWRELGILKHKHTHNTNNCKWIEARCVLVTYNHWARWLYAAQTSRFRTAEESATTFSCP